MTEADAEGDRVMSDSRGMPTTGFTERQRANVEWLHGHMGKIVYSSQAKADLMKLHMLSKGRGVPGVLESYPCTWTDEFTFPKVRGNKHWHVGNQSVKWREANHGQGATES